MTSGEPTRGERPTALPDAWDDDRLAAAFLERYDRPAPHELSFATLERVRATSRRPGWWPSVGRPTALRLASVVAVVAFLAVVVAPRAGITPGSSAAPTTPNTIPSPAQNTPYQSFPASPAVARFPAEVAGLPVRSVPDAIALAAGGDVGDMELAVAGWYSARSLALPCPERPTPASPLEVDCPDLTTWLSASDQPVLAADGTSLTSPGMDRVISPLFLAPVEPLAVGTAADPRTNVVPHPVVLLGHYDDERSARCTSDRIAACHATFVVDLVATSLGGRLDTPTSFAGPDITPQLLPDEAWQQARARVERGPVTLLTIGLVSGCDAPWFSAESSCSRTLTWFARGFRIVPNDGIDPRGGSPVAGWLAIDDATGVISGPLAEAVPPQPPPYKYELPPDGFPASIEGLPVRTVADATDPARPSDTAGAPLAIAGWYTRLPPHRCPSAPPDCNRDTIILAGTDRRLLSFDTVGTPTVVTSDGPILNPVSLPGGAEPPAGNPDGRPRRAILVVHQGDPRADRDGPGQPIAGTDFVLDQVAWLDGAEQPATAWIEPGIKPIRTLSDVLVTAGPMRVGQTWLVSAAAVRAGDLAMIGAEPSSNDMTGIVWVLRLVGANPVGGSGGLPGWGSILVEETTGQFETRWTSP